jgi:hypothetical protein
MEVHPGYCDKSLWIYYNNLDGDPYLNTDKVVLGGEAPGENVGWLIWWIVKRDLRYVTSASELISVIATQKNETNHF